MKKAKKNRLIRNDICINGVVSFLKHDNDDEKASELNYLSFSIALFETTNKQLLNALFGIEGTNVGLMTPICDRYGGFVFSKANIFLVMYTYYLAYRESEDIVTQEERDLCRQLLERAGHFFWYNLSSRFYGNTGSVYNHLGEHFSWFSEKMNLYMKCVI